MGPPEGAMNLNKRLIFGEKLNQAVMTYFFERTRRQLSRRRPKFLFDGL